MFGNVVTNTKAYKISKIYVGQSKFVKYPEGPKYIQKCSPHLPAWLFLFSFPIVSVKMFVIFWIFVPCDLLVSFWRFGGTYYVCSASLTFVQVNAFTQNRMLKICFYTCANLKLTESTRIYAINMCSFIAFLKKKPLTSFGHVTFTCVILKYFFVHTRGFLQSVLQNFPAYLLIIFLIIYCWCTICSRNITTVLKILIFT